MYPSGWPARRGRTKLLALLCAVGVVCGTCTGGPTAPSPRPPGSTEAVLVGAGDIAMCGSPGAEATARLLDAIGGTVFTAGDNAYPNGSAADYRDCYGPTWGRHRDRTRPTFGNHDYETGSASPSFEYFDQSAGPPGQGYYVYAVGPWRVIALNSEIPVRAGSPQYQWLSTELTTVTTACTLTIWHRPLFSSGPNRDNPEMRDVFKLLYDFGAEIVVNGHDHLYERFVPVDPDGRSDPARGIRQFIVGTGGAPLYEPGQRKSTSEALLKAWGVLKLTLANGRYDWEFVSVPGTGVRDSGSGVCH